MKKLLLSLGAAFLLAAGAQAQTSYGIKAGVNLGKISNSGIGGEFEGAGVSIKDVTNPSFYVTGFADISVAPNFSVQPGLSLQGKGAKTTAKQDDNSAHISVNLMSIEIPVNAVYYIPTGTSGSVFLGAGPYAGYNVSGKIAGKLNGEKIDFDGNDKIDFSGDDKDMNAFDYGVNFLGGYKLSNGLIINAGYGLGLADLIPDDNKTSSNRVLSFGVGFQF